MVLKIFIPLASFLFILAFSGCQTTGSGNGQTTGAILGAIAGGIAGNNLGDGSDANVVIFGHELGHNAFHLSVVRVHDHGVARLVVVARELERLIRETCPRRRLQLEKSS